MTYEEPNIIENSLSPMNVDITTNPNRDSFGSIYLLDNVFSHIVDKENDGNKKKEVKAGN
jgi:hypothetical protein